MIFAGKTLRTNQKSVLAKYKHGYTSKKVEIYPQKGGIDNTKEEENRGRGKAPRQKYTECMILEIWVWDKIQEREYEMMVVGEREQSVYAMWSKEGDAK